MHAPRKCSALLEKRTVGTPMVFLLLLLSAFLTFALLPAGHRAVHECRHERQSDAGDAAAQRGGRMKVFNLYMLFRVLGQRPPAWATRLYHVLRALGL